MMWWLPMAPAAAVGVVRADGPYGGYRGGPVAKRTLLVLESA